MVRDNFKPTLFLNKALNFYPPPSTKSEVISSSPFLLYMRCDMILVASCS